MNQASACDFTGASPHPSWFLPLIYANVLILLVMCSQPCSWWRMYTSEHSSNREIIGMYSTWFCQPALWHWSDKSSSIKEIKILEPTPKILHMFFEKALTCSLWDNDCDEFILFFFSASLTRVIIFDNCVLVLQFCTFLLLLMLYPSDCFRVSLICR